MIEEIQGNILDIKRGIIVHQVNCKKVMNAGLAKKIRAKYPSHYYQYLNTDPYLGQVMITRINPVLIILAFYSQDDFGYNKRFTDYDAFDQCLTIAESIHNAYKLPIYFPYKIGCGYGGGDWKVVNSLIWKHFKDSDAKIIKP